MFDLITRIHAAPQCLVLEFTGAGSQALAWLHGVGGSSRTVLEATDRYAHTSLIDLLGFTPAQFVSAETAAAMAERAYRRALDLGPGMPVLGIGCTATIATDRLKKGSHACQIALRSSSERRGYALLISKGARDRRAEEELVSQVILTAIAEGCGLDGPVLDLLPDERLEQTRSTVDDPLGMLIEGQARHVLVSPDGTQQADAAIRGAVLSGSFNPLHRGHAALARVAAQRLGMPVFFELPIVNADKPPLRIGEIERRLAQFRDRASVVISRAPLFVQKAELFPGSVFVIGFDTAVRLVEQRYYGDSAGRDAALEQVRAQGCRFLVAGRLNGDQFQTLADLAIPAGFADLFAGLNGEEFRMDISSTQLRRGATDHHAAT